MGTLPTVKVQAETKSGFMTINESDFDKRVHKLYKEPEIRQPEVQESEVEELEPKPYIKRKTKDRKEINNGNL